MSASQASAGTAFSIGDDHDDLRAEFDTDFEGVAGHGRVEWEATDDTTADCPGPVTYSGIVSCCVDY